MDRFCCYTFLGSKNYDLKIKIDYSKEIILYSLVALDLLHLFYLFGIMIHYRGLFQSNQNTPPSANQRLEVYSAITIALVPTLEVDFEYSSYSQYV